MCFPAPSTTTCVAPSALKSETVGSIFFVLSPEMRDRVSQTVNLEEVT